MIAPQLTDAWASSHFCGRLHPMGEKGDRELTRNRPGAALEHHISAGETRRCNFPGELVSAAERDADSGGPRVGGRATEVSHDIQYDRQRKHQLRHCRTARRRSPEGARQAIEDRRDARAPTVLQIHQGVVQVARR
eukprot:3495295-Lingulodinium_polyedra.AAC.1